MDFVIGFLPRPPRDPSPCSDGRKILVLSPEEGLSSIFLTTSEEFQLQRLKMRKSAEIRAGSTSCSGSAPRP